MEVRRRTERAANQLDSLIANEGMPLAPAKSQWMIFTRRKIAPSPPDIVVWGEPVSCSGGAKFLGLHLDSRMKWQRHITEIKRKAKKRVNFMHTLAGHSWGSQPSVLLIIYKTLVRSIFDFNAGIYDSGSKDRWNQLERVQSAAL